MARLHSSCPLDSASERSEGPPEGADQLRRLELAQQSGPSAFEIPSGARLLGGLTGAGFFELEPGAVYSGVVRKPPYVSIPGIPRVPAHLGVGSGALAQGFR